MNAPGRATARQWPWATAAFVVLMLALTAVFAALGFWQWQRLGEKTALIAAVEDRLQRPPGEIPDDSLWPGLDAEFYNYRPLTFMGRFVPEQTVLVFTSLASPRGRYSGPGYWVMTPLQLVDGGTIFVNRGFVPEQSRAAFAAGGAVPLGPVTLTGIGRTSEEAGSFTPGADAARRLDWVRDTGRMAAMVDPELGPFAPFYTDLPAGPPGALPQGGETVVSFPNNHFGYALTWFGFAILTPALLAYWLWRRRRPEAAP